jgi:hypothetical protein
MRRYSVAPAVLTGDSALVAVTYYRLGHVAHRGGRALHFVADSATETVLFALCRIGGTWKIAAPEIDKHGSIRVDRACDAAQVTY